MSDTWIDLLFGELENNFLDNFLWDGDYCHHCEIYHGRSSTFDPECRACREAADDGEFSTCTYHADECTAYVDNPDEWGVCPSCGHIDDCECDNRSDCSCGNRYCDEPRGHYR